MKDWQYYGLQVPLWLIASHTSLMVDHKLFYEISVALAAISACKYVGAYLGRDD